MTDGWTERTLRPAGSRSKALSAPRSLGAALRDAGFADAAPDRQPVASRYSAILDLHDRDLHDDADDEPVAARSAATPSAASIIAASRSPRLAVFAGPDEIPPPIVTPLHHEAGVVSPPPWLRAARRGRWRTRLLNTFGWVMTLVVAGSIIGVAGHYLGVAPPGLEATLQARQ